MRNSMANDSGTTTSLWMDTEVPDFQPRLPARSDVDVCVIGAGVAGITSAYLLAKEGKRVIVLDDGPIGGGETSRTTAHLACVQDDRFAHLQRIHGKERLRLITESHAVAIDTIESACTREKIACSFRRVDGYLFNPPDRGPRSLERELRAAQRAGLHDAEMIERAPLPGFDTGPAIRFPMQAQLHPLSYLAGLANAAVRMGVQIHSRVHVERIEREGGKPVVVSGAKRVGCDAVVVATNASISSPLSIPMRQAAYRSYVVCFAISRGALPPGLFWDTEDPYHYARLAADDRSSAQDVLIVGGEDHKTGQGGDSEERYERLTRWTRSRFPAAREVLTRWSGQVMEPADGIAFIGKNPGDDDVFVITGDSGQGMTHGTLGAILIGDLIMGRPNPWARLYDPSRVSLRALGALVRENLNVAAQYLDWLAPGQVRSVDEIRPGSGAVLRRGLELVAVYRDERGACHARSAACTHMKGIVSFNEAEKTWDCPCHGARYDAYGRVLNGPATSDLSPLDAATSQGILTRRARG